MSHALLLVPDFLLILCGFVLCRWTALDRSVWDGVERLVYYLLFPVLLFNSILKSPLQLGTTLSLGLSGLAVTACGVLLAYALRWLPGVDARLHASGAQTAFRFNTFIALALAERLAGPQGLAWIALLVALCVPLCNVAAVWPLARHGGHGYLREIARNPLILATAAGLLANLAGLRFPDAVAATLQRIGVAALPLGLMAVGAGLKLGALKAAPGLAAALLTIRHVLLPLLAVGLCLWLPLPPQQSLVLVAFAALSTASSAYVLAVRMGGHGAFVAGLVTVSTLLCALSVPLWLAVLEALQALQALQ
ncbi:MAG TPA: AEC family transporter [Rubrivivax sp.]|nr:AEC family transporter [Rubrivivax sp.]